MTELFSPFAPKPKKFKLATESAVRRATFQDFPRTSEPSEVRKVVNDALQRDLRVSCVNANASLGIPLCLRKVAAAFINCEVEPNAASAIIQVTNPKCRVRIYPSGKIQLRGGPGADMSKLVIKKIARRIKTHVESRIRLTNFKITGIFANYYHANSLDLLTLAKGLRERDISCTYEPEFGAGIVIRNGKETPCTITLHASGKIGLWGTDMDYILTCLHNALRELEAFYAPVTRKRGRPSL